MAETIYELAEAMVLTITVVCWAFLTILGAVLIVAAPFLISALVIKLLSVIFGFKFLWYVPLIVGLAFWLCVGEVTIG